MFIRAILAVLVPLVLMIGFVLVAEAVAYASPWGKALIGNVGLVVSPIIGLLVLIGDSHLSQSGRRVVFVRPDLRQYAVVIGLAYLPLMFGLVTYFGLMLTSLLFGDSV